MTKLEMWSEVFKDKPRTLSDNPNMLDELYNELTWLETRKVYVTLNWFRVHDKHRFLQYRSLIFYAGDIKGAYDYILTRYKKEMKMRGKRL